MTIKISEIIKDRVIKDNGSFFANDNISKYFETEDELDLLLYEVQDKVEDLLNSLIIDVENDHNTRETAKRVAKMYINEVFKGRYHPSPQVTDFPNIKHLDEMYIVGPVSIRSACSHHFVPIVGKAWIGIMPSERVIGISKFNRIVDWIMSRPHIQEEAAIMLADELENLMNPKGLAVLIKAQHLCMTWRGVKDNDTVMTNSIMRGVFREDGNLRSEFLNTVRD